MTEYLGHIQQNPQHKWLIILHQLVMGGENNHVTPIQQSQTARFRHIACDDKPDCITTNNMPANMTMTSSPSPVKGEKRIRSG